ncbi:hypothetical protein JCM1393_01000 [Clostridium carnis]
MKYGIDINNLNVLKAISERMKDSGHYIVDFSQEASSNKGQLVFRKTLLANITNVDFYLCMEFEDKLLEYEIFYDDNNLSKICSEKIKKLLSLKNEKIIYDVGTHLYLVKNINAPTLYIRIPKEDIGLIEERYIDSIVDILIDI